jgi:hypothetical protein
VYLVAWKYKYACGYVAANGSLLAYQICTGTGDSGVDLSFVVDGCFSVLRFSYV